MLISSYPKPRIGKTSTAVAARVVYDSYAHTGPRHRRRSLYTV
jgi:hypothetical protein